MGRILAIDYGRSRVGLAVSDALGITVRPLAAADGRDRAALLAALQVLCREEEVAEILLGLPLRLDGSEGEAVAEVREFAAALQAVVPLPVTEVDERLTSRQAHAVLKQGGLSHRQRKERVDSTAAVLLLRGHLAGR